MTMPAQAAVGDATSDALANLALGDPGVLRAVAPQAGRPGIVAAAPGLVLAPGLARPGPV
ncbi:MAG: hypothetical protein JWL68_191 [Actinomycetia bacterium]|jgi:hypothetical protein|nr:hypothetical protein [Actinomycetes bacterium]